MKAVIHILYSALVFTASMALADTPLVTNLADGHNGKFLFKSVDRKTTGVQLASGKFQMTDTTRGCYELGSWHGIKGKPTGRA
jgi:hypothetical protein